MCFSKINGWHNAWYKWKFMWKYSNKIIELVMYGASSLIWQCVSCPHTTHACTCPLPSFTSQTELTSSPVSYIPKQSSTIHPYGPLIWPGFHNTHAYQPEPPALTITNGESSSPISQSHANATLPSPQPPTPSGPSQPIDQLSPLFYWFMCKKNHYFIDLLVILAFSINLMTEWCFKNLNVTR